MLQYSFPSRMFECFCNDSSMGWAEFPQFLHSRLKRLRLGNKPYNMDILINYDSIMSQCTFLTLSFVDISFILYTFLLKKEKMFAF